METDAKIKNHQDKKNLPLLEGQFGARLTAFDEV